MKPTSRTSWAFVDAGCAVSEGDEANNKKSIKVTVTPDAGPPDASPPDQGTPDQGTPDMGTPDQAAPDQGTPDKGTPDKGTPDKGTPDKGTPDKAAPDAKDVAPDAGPDASIPDTRGPDAPLPDTRGPDGARPDRGGPDTSASTEGGASTVDAGESKDPEDTSGCGCDVRNQDSDGATGVVLLALLLAWRRSRKSTPCRVPRIH